MGWVAFLLKELFCKSLRGGRLQGNCSTETYVGGTHSRMLAYEVRTTVPYSGMFLQPAVSCRWSRRGCLTTVVQRL